MTMSIDQVRTALRARRDRFEVFPDPSNNYWIVWDLDEDTVAELGTQLLQHLSEGKARAFCSRLNRPIRKARLFSRVHSPKSLTNIRSSPLKWRRFEG